MTVIKIDDSNKFGKLSLDRLIEFEKLHKFKLPDDYRLFLLEHNGGKPTPELIDFVQYGRSQSDIVNNLFGIHDGEYWARLEWRIQSLENRIPLGFIPIGDDPGGNSYLMGVDGEYSGKVYFWDHENEAEVFAKETDFETMSFIANSFTDFLNKLYTKESNRH